MIDDATEVQRWQDAAADLGRCFAAANERIRELESQNNFDAARLRTLASICGVGVPDSDEELLGVAGVVLGSIRRVVERLYATPHPCKPGYTHRKRPYHAQCVQWDGSNTDQITALLGDVELYRGKYLLVRHAQGVDTLRIRSWVVKGENGQVKVYSDEVFRVKYEAAR